MPGQYYDRATNLFYNYYRDYDPQTGRYVQSDPIGLEGGLNTYSYVEANPLDNADPDGLRPRPQNRTGGSAGTTRYPPLTDSRATGRRQQEGHHSFPEFLNGPAQQDLTTMSRHRHDMIHRDLNDHLYAVTNPLGQHMRPQRGNPGGRITSNFTREQIIQALRDFYRKYGHKYPDAARDFYRQFSPNEC